MVGDVKQSIYRFRQAMPKLFLDKYETFGTVTKSLQDKIRQKMTQKVIQMKTVPHVQEEKYSCSKTLEVETIY